MFIKKSLVKPGMVPSNDGCGSNWGRFSPWGDNWQCLETGSVVIPGRWWDAAGIGWVKARVLFNIPWCIGQSPQSEFVVSNCWGPLTVAHQAPLSMEFSRQEYWSRLPLPSPGDLPNQGVEPISPTLADRFFTTEPPGKLTNKKWYLFSAYYI